jgi:hypothetical protein
VPALKLEFLSEPIDVRFSHAHSGESIGQRSQIAITAFYFCAVFFHSVSRGEAHNDRPRPYFLQLSASVGRGISCCTVGRLVFSLKHLRVE